MKQRTELLIKLEEKLTLTVLWKSGTAAVVLPETDAFLGTVMHISFAVGIAKSSLGKNTHKRITVMRLGGSILEKMPAVQ